MNQNKANFTYFNIRSNQAAIDFSRHRGYTISYLADELKYDSKDAIWFNPSINQREIIEIKIRNHYSTDFDGNFILEYRKWSELIAEADRQAELGEQLPSAVYILFLKDCTLKWNMNDVQEEDFFEEEFAENSATDNLSKKKLKKVCYVKTKTAARCNYIINYDELKNKSRIVFEYKFPNDLHLIQEGKIALYE